MKTITKHQAPLELSHNFVARDLAGYELTFHYTSFPGKIDAFMLFYLKKGHIRAAINLGEYDINPGDLVVLMPGSFLQVLECDDNAMLGMEGFSSELLNEINFWKTIAPIVERVFKSPVFSLNEQVGAFFSNAFGVMKHIVELDHSFITTAVAQSAMVVAIETLHNAIAKDMVKGENSARHNSRQQTIVGNFMQLALRNYRTHHQIQFYATAAGLSLSHFCNVVSKTTGTTAQKIIMNLIVMDAKTQLRSTDLSVAQVSQLLGFKSPTTFNRYFKNYTGMTPQDYRNSGND